MKLLEGKPAIVTGAGQGLGRAYAEAMAEAGALVVVNDVQQALAEEAASAIRDKGGKAVASAHSIASFDETAKMADLCRSEFGDCEVLVNNAGINRDRAIWNMTEEEWRTVIDVNLTGYFNCTRHVVNWMRDNKRGVILNTTSAAHYGNFGQSNYGASKGGIATLTYTWAVELARYGVRVNGISPSAQTGMTATIPPGAAERRRAEGFEVLEGEGLSRKGPESVAPLVVYLASDEAHWITGQIFGIRGDMLNMVSHPRDKGRSFKVGGWTVDDLCRLMPIVYRELEPVGQGSLHYRWYEGVKPQE